MQCSRLTTHGSESIEESNKREETGLGRTGGVGHSSRVEKSAQSFVLKSGDNQPPASSLGLDISIGWIFECWREPSGANVAEFRTW
jgi:hypothetical protein